MFYGSRMKIPWNWKSPNVLDGRRFQLRPPLAKPRSRPAGKFPKENIFLLEILNGNFTERYKEAATRCFMVHAASSLQLFFSYLMQKAVATSGKKVLKLGKGRTNQPSSPWPRGRRWTRAARRRFRRRRRRPPGRPGGPWRRRGRGGRRRRGPATGEGRLSQKKSMKKNA